ncbi:MULTISPECIES: hypothetical protein [Burkholderia]|uniref:hypothetical protein n=1 Tax=Burkholderia TaxID=32008 RepID=UPI0008415169|nr:MULTISPECIES: hypothetical protein [unclassified Burkholderia]AOK32239.1 hypothetical protein AQ611_22595 [Burkholderia sp. Bp7605]
MNELRRHASPTLFDALLRASLYGFHSCIAAFLHAARFAFLHEPVRPSIDAAVECPGDAPDHAAVTA